MARRKWLQAKKFVGLHPNETVLRLNTNKAVKRSSNKSREMKKLIIAAAVAGMLTSARAQLLSFESTSGLLLGGVAGGIIGANTGGHHTGQGIAIGAASGLLLGSVVGAVNRDNYAYRGDYYRGYPYGYYASPYYVGYTYPAPVNYPATTPTTVTLQPPAQPKPKAVNVNKMAAANSFFGRLKCHAQ